MNAAAPFRSVPQTHRNLAAQPNGRRLQGRRGGGALLAGHRRGGAADRLPSRPPAAPLPGAAGERLPVVRRLVRPLPPRRPAAVPARLRLARPHLPLAGLHRQPLWHPRAPPLGRRRHHPYGRRHHAYILVCHIWGDVGIRDSITKAGQVLLCVRGGCCRSSSAWPLLVLRFGDAGFCS
ncbi:hypothetical protein PVAP13_3NG239000 [Panicum virgatum]|uniref:Uncharacterized protein n=1 Tax=Panicum virgatum TaxID=38727 RepID=A0A8T0UH95_PANVG|nr:hypothetical protein PVAP13_3NG239000 [Panicum virgatum]